MTDASLSSQPSATPADPVDLAANPAATQDRAQTPERFDLLVVGAGIVGLSHAWEATQRGLRVCVLERSERAVGASVRNFGHCCLSAQPDVHDELVRESRTGWLAMTEQTGIWARTDGGSVVARSAAQQQLLEEFVAARPERGRLLTRDEVEERLTGGRRELPEVTGGVALLNDLRVDPRTTVGLLAEALAARGVSFHWRTTCLGVADGVVETSRGRFTADQVVVAVGHDVDELWPEIADAAQVQRCALQMALVAQPADFSTWAATLTATSMLRYGGLAAMPAAAQVRAELQQQAPELLEMVANVMFAPRPDGTLLVGDSHHYDLAIEPILTESTSARLLTEVSGILGLDGLQVLQRWQGIYASSPLSDVLDERPDGRTSIISVTSGVGMTLSFGLARRTLARLGA